MTTAVTHRIVGIEDCMPFDAIKSYAQRYWCHEWKAPEANMTDNNRQ
jgi:hypothetical protein